MDAIRTMLAQSEPLLLFTVIAFGFVAGQLRLGNFSLGVSGVLFVGLAAGAWRTEGQAPLALAPEIAQLGLILFVYAVGLTSGPGFVAALRTRGARYNLAATASLCAGAAVAWALGRALGLPIAQVAGAFCGALTNTPALAAVDERAIAMGIGQPGDAAVGYSMAYPFGVLGALVAFELFARLSRGALAAERAAAAGAPSVRLVSANFEIRNPAVAGRAIGELRVQESAGVIVSRLRHGGQVAIPTKYSLLHEGDVVVAVGTADALARAEAYFGARSGAHLEQVNDRIAMRRILVSRRALAGRSIEDLELDRRFNAQVTRLRRADIDFMPAPDTVLELGDRLRVVMPADKTAEVTAYFGDSERSIAELDYTALTLGISLGVLLGMLPIPMPGGASVALGFAGGPLVAGILLGYRGRTGPLIWALPLEANHAIRHIGLLFFLAGVGIMAGDRFAAALAGPGPALLAVGAATTAATTALALVLLRWAAGASAVAAIGAASGMQTQPATLAKACEITRSDETYVAYAITYPVAMVGKILIGQLLLLMG